MSDTPTLFDPPPADTLAPAAQARDEALTVVQANTDPDWAALALEAVRQTCLAMDTFISDDIWEVGQLASTVEDRALGPVLRRAARQGWCVKTDRTRKSIRSHLSGKPVWRSMLR